MPASAGEHGPGDRMMWLGASASISSDVIASLRRTTASPPSSRTYRARLWTNES